MLPPRRRADILRRARLIDFLHRHIEDKLIVVSAAAGYGKTTLLVDFAHDVDIPVCWYSIDARDQDPRAFLDYLMAAICSKFSDFGTMTEACLQSTMDLEKQKESIIGTLVTDMHTNIPQYFLLVLDDYHLVEESPAIVTIMDLLLKHLPENCHILLASRTLPRLPTLPHLLALREASMLTTDDLRLTAEEVRDFLTIIHGLHVSLEWAEEIASAFGGWASGLILATPRLLDGNVEEALQQTVQTGQLPEYFMSEVYVRQPKEIQEFLLASSILAELNPRECQAIIGVADSKAILTHIEKQNLLVTQVAGGEPWYRYHHLFQEFLRAKLKRERPDQFRVLHVAAANYYESEKKAQRAIEHWLSAGAYDQAAGSLEAAAGEIFESGKCYTLATWIDALPEQILARRPWLLFWRSKIYSEVGEADEAIKLARSACQKFEAVGEGLGIVYSLLAQGTAYRFKGEHLAAIRVCQNALSILSQNGGAGAAAEAEIHKHIGISYGRLGNFTLAVEYLAKSASFFNLTGDLFNVSVVNEALGIAYGELGDLIKGLAHLHQAEAGWRHLDNRTWRAATLNNIAMAYYCLGDYDSAMTFACQAEEEARNTKNLRTQSYALETIGMIQLDENMYEDALGTLTAALEGAKECLEADLVATVTDLIGNTYRLLGNLDKAELLIKQALTRADAQASAHEQGRCQTSMALILCERRELKDAISRLEISCKLLEQTGAKRDLTKAHFCLGQAYFLARQFTEAQNELYIASNLADALGYHHLLLIEGRRVPVFVQYAALKRIGGEYFARLWEKIKTQSQAAAKMTQPSVQPFQGASFEIEVCSLGQAKVVVDSKVVTDLEWRSQKSKEMFFFLLWKNSWVRKEQVVDALWPDLSPAKCNSSFHSNAYRLRRALHPTCLTREEGHYRLNPELHYSFDAHEFRELTDKAKELPEGSHEGAAYFQKALRLYRGPFLEEFYSEWCETVRRLLEEKYLRCLATLAGFHAARQEYEESAELCERILEVDPYQEDARYQLLCCHLELKDYATADKCYRRYVELVRQELGAEPAPRIVSLYGQMRNGGRLA